MKENNINLGVWMLNIEQGTFLVRLARNAIEKYLEENIIIGAPQCDEELKKKRGVFCTLKTYPLNVLRGCIGFPYPVKPLVDATIEAAISSAVNDPRFRPVEKDELKSIVVELTVLTEPELLDVPRDELPKHIEIGRHGLIVERGYASGLLLPQVPEEAGWKTAEEFLAGTCWKAGLDESAWKDEKTRVYRFEGQIFKETKPNGEVIEE